MNAEEGSEARAVAIRAFKWILSSYRPLRLSELSYAAAIRDDGALDAEVDNDFVLDVCSNFVTIDTSEHPQFVHASVHEFLEDLEIDESKVYSERFVHTQAAKTCLVYLTSSMYLSEKYLFTGFPAYVRNFWALHCRACEDNRTEDNVLRKSLSDFLSLEVVHPGFRYWHKSTIQRRRYGYGPGRREMEDCSSPEPNPFLVTCIFGFPELVEKHRTEDRAILESRNAVSLSGLTLACKYGNEDIALMLLKNGASIDTRDEWHEIPLISAVTPLISAVTQGSEALVRMLLEAGADVESEDGCGERPLFTAVWSGSIPLVRMLLEFKADPNIMYEGQTCLELAIERCHEDVARLLREAGAKTFKPDSIYISI